MVVGRRGQEHGHGLLPLLLPFSPLPVGRGGGAVDEGAGGPGEEAVHAGGARVGQQRVAVRVVLAGRDAEDEAAVFLLPPSLLHLLHLPLLLRLLQPVRDSVASGCTASLLVISI